MTKRHSSRFMEAEMWVGVPGEGSQGSGQCMLPPQVSARPRVGHVTCSPVALKVILRVLSSVGVHSGEKAEFEFPEGLPSSLLGPVADAGRWCEAIWVIS